MFREAKETEYKGILYRSKLEANVAEWFDILNLEFEYEPYRILLKGDIHYVPDFYVSSLKLYVEPRGYWSLQAERKIQKFFDWLYLERKGKEEYLFITDQKYTLKWYGGDEETINCTTFFESHYESQYMLKDDALLARCDKCGSYFFISSVSSWTCRNCRAYNGDGHLMKWVVEDGYRYLMKFSENLDRLFFGRNHYNEMEMWLRRHGYRDIF